MMKILNKVLFTFPFLLFLISIGCYDVPFLVDSEEKAITRKELIGVWKRTKEESYGRIKNIIISKEDADTKLYKARVNEIDDISRDFNFLLHDLDGKIIISAMKPNTSKKSYSIFRLILNSETARQILTVEALIETAPRFDSPKEFRAFLASEESNELFDRAMKFEKDAH